MIACLCRHHAAAQVHGIGQRLLDNRCQTNGLLVNFTYQFFFVYRQFSGTGGGPASESSCLASSNMLWSYVGKIASKIASKIDSVKEVGSRCTLICQCASRSVNLRMGEVA